MTVRARTCCPAWVRTSDDRILSAFPVAPIISGSQRTEKTSPMSGSIVLNGSRTSSSGPFMNLRDGKRPPCESRAALNTTATTRTTFGTHPGTVMKKLTRLLLCNGWNSNVLTCLVRLAIALPPMTDPVSVAPDEMMAAPPAPARKPVVPVTPTVVSAAPRPAPMTGARRPAERPITRPPPGEERMF